MGKNLRLAIGKDERQFVRKALPIVQDPSAILFLFFPMIGELDRSPVSNVAVFTIAEHAIEHSCSAE